MKKLNQKFLNPGTNKWSMPAKKEAGNCFRLSCPPEANRMERTLLLACTLSAFMEGSGSDMDLTTQLAVKEGLKTRD